MDSAYSRPAPCHGGDTRVTHSELTGFINIRSWFCNDWDMCPLFVGDAPVKRDVVHTTRQHAEEVVRLFRNESELILSRG